MSGVSVRVLTMLLDTAAAEGMRVEDLTKDLGLSPHDLLHLSERIEWDRFATICDRIGERLGSPEAMAEFGEHLAPAESIRVLRLIGRLSYDPRDLLSIGAHWIGPTMLPMIEARVQELPHGVFIERLVIQDGHRHCPSFFHILSGFLAASPLQWGNPRSEIETTIEPRGAILRIRPHMGNLGLISRLLRRIRGRTAYRRVMQQLEEQRSDIHASYREVLSARDRIAAQARELEQVNGIGRELSRHIELDQVADVLTQVLLEDLAFDGVRLVLDVTSQLEEVEDNPNRVVGADEPTIREAGSTTGSPSGEYTLQAAAGAIGTLSVWRADRHARGPEKARGGIEPTEDSLLERLLPWISIALENARTYRELESHAADLQSRVLERTARLLTTNHHLVREIEERKQATEALLVSEAQLRAAERMASVGTLAAGIAHEINNPVGSILAAAQFALIVRDEAGSETQVSDSLTDIVREAKRCGEIVRSVLQFSRDERTEKWDCRLQDIVHRAVRLTDPYTAEFQARVHPVLPEQDIWVCVNPIQIEQALVNLIRNAIEAKGHEIQVVVESVESDRLAYIEVRDDGAGISHDVQTRVFEPFYTTKRSDGGTGLGLSVVHGIVKEHGGTLKVSPQADVGASVLIELPMVSSPGKALPEKPEPPLLTALSEGGSSD